MLYFSDMGKTSFRDFFRLPELALLLATPLLPLGGWTLMLIASWLLHVWLRQGDKGHTSLGRRAQVIVTVASCLMIALIAWVCSAIRFTPTIQDNSLAGVFVSLFEIPFYLAAIWPVYLLTLLAVGIFLLAQISFWAVGISRLWRTRKGAG